MRQIMDLPRGGAAKSGKSVWFALRLEDDSELELSLRAEQLEAFIAGLRTFERQASAMAARTDKRPSGHAYLIADKFEATLSPDQTLMLALGESNRGLVRVMIPKNRVRLFLSTVLKAISVGSRVP